MQSRSARKRRWSAAVGVLTALMLAIAGFALPAQAAPAGWYCYRTDSTACVSQFGYTGKSVWGYPVDAHGNNCTNYAAFRLSQNGVADPGNLGNASEWAANAAAKKIPVNQTPTVGSIAQWVSADHVAYVDWVSPDGTQIAVSESGYAGSYPSMSGRSVINKNSSNTYAQSNDLTWPSNFIHFSNSGSGTAGTTAAYESAFQANTGSLILYGTAAKVNTGLGMMKGTSPAIAVNSSGQYQAAFEANTSVLWTYSSPGGAADVGQAMMPGTSPSIAPLSNGKFEVAFQSSRGSLVVYGNAVKVNTGLGMMKGTSPAIAVNSAGQIQVAFQANTGALWTYSYPGGAADVGQTMMKGTSPTIAPLANGKFEVAFQASSGAMVVYGNAVKVNTGLGMMKGSSPTIALNSSNQVQAGMNANTGTLWTYSYPGGAAHPAQSIRSSTSPSVEPLPNGKFEYALQSSAGQLWFVGNASTQNTGQGMMAGTSPAIAGTR